MLKFEIIYKDEDGNVVTDPPPEALLLGALLGGLKQSSELADDEIFKIDSNDNYTHLQSGFICPKEWSGFQRTEATIYKQTGNDVGCNYINADSSLVTIYAYSYSNLGPIGDELDQVMEQIVKARHPIHEDADMIIGAPPRENKFGYIGDAITFDDPNGETIKSGLFLADAGTWRLKVRVTYLENHARDVETFAGSSLQGQWDRIMRQALPEPQTPPLPMPGGEVEA